MHVYCVLCVQLDRWILDGDCSGEIGEDVPIDDEAMNGKMKDALL